MANKYQQEMKKEAEVETFSNGSLFVLSKSFDSIKYWVKFNDNFYILP